MNSFIGNSILGLIQGLTELLPVSSSGHLVVAHSIIGSLGSADLTFDALLHFATTLAILLYFRRDIWRLTKALARAVKKIYTKTTLEKYEAMAIAIVVATIPAVIFGLLLEHSMSTLFRSPHLVAGVLIVGSIIMFVADKKYAKQTQSDNTEEGHKNMTLKDGLIVGLFQSLALVPGMSRSGMSIVGGMLVGLTRAEAARFAFLLGIPILLGAGSKKILEAGVANITPSMWVGAFVAFVVAMAVIHFLLEFLKKNTLLVFVIYRVVLAAAILLLI